MKLSSVLDEMVLDESVFEKAKQLALVVPGRGANARSSE